MGNRKEATELILNYVEKILPGGGNKEIYEELFAKMSDSKFKEFMEKLRGGDETLFLISPNMGKAKLNTLRNVKLAKQLGHEMFQRIWLTDPATGTKYLSPIKYLVIDLPVRRPAQTLSKKISIPKDNSRVDELTGQTAADRAGGISFPELQTLHAQGLDVSVTELIKYRGGDEEALRLMNDQILKTGDVDLDTINVNSRAKSTDTLSILLKAMHLENNL